MQLLYLSCDCGFYCYQFTHAFEILSCEVSFERGRSTAKPFLPLGVSRMLMRWGFLMCSFFETATQCIDVQICHFVPGKTVQLIGGSAHWAGDGTLIGHLILSCWFVHLNWTDYFESNSWSVHITTTSAQPERCEGFDFTTLVCSWYLDLSR